MQNARLDELQVENKTAGRNINNLRYVDDTTLMAENEEELKSLLMKVKRESEKAGLKLNIQKTKIVESGRITSWQIDGEAMETVTDFIFLGFKIAADSDCSKEIKWCLLLGRKAMTKLDGILKKQAYHLANKDPYTQSCGFSSSHTLCESWTRRRSNQSTPGVQSLSSLSHVWLLWPLRDCSTPGFPVLRYFPEFVQTHVHWVDDAIHPSHPLSPLTTLALNLSQYQGLFQWISSSHQVDRVLEL